MWILEHDGQLLQGKRMWLRPGRSYLFGRTVKQNSPKDRVWHIDNGSVSRKHMVISIEEAAPGHGTNPLSRSKVIIQNDSKIGTFVDGNAIPKQELYHLNGTRHTIQLGHWAQTFTISWRQTCFSLQLPSKILKHDLEGALRPYRERFESLDIKTIPDYSIQGTTHLVSAKRNIPKGLQALVNAKYIVTDDFLVAVEQAAQSPGLDDDGVSPLASPLEDDFEAHWPDAMLFLPGPGKEPHPRPVEKFAPDLSRIELFKGFTFVFADKNQYELLKHPLLNGQAKCELREVELGVTRVEDFVAQVREIAQKRGETTGEFLTENHAGVTVVRFRGKDETAQWALDFLRQLDSELNQRSAEQNEFLDAILMNDTRQLRQPLPEEDSDSGIRAPPSTAVSRVVSSAARVADTQMQEVQPDEEPASSATKPVNPPPSSSSSMTSQGFRRRRAPRTAPAQRFRGFDDFEEDNFEPKRSPSPPGQVSQAAPPSAQHDPGDEPMHMTDAPDSQPLFVAEDAPSDNIPQKRKAPTPEPDPVDDNILPGAAAMKKRRLAAGQTLEPARSKPVTREPKPKKELDVRGTAQAHAKALDRRVDFDRADPEAGTTSDHEMPDPEEVAQMRNLALVEDMPLRAAPNKPQAQDHDARWKPEWNGRKNFKAFRRRGAAQAERGISKVIVTLEEVKRRDFGAGEDGWMDVAAAPRRDESRPPASASASRDRARTARGQRLHRGEEEDRDEVIAIISDEEREEFVPEEMAGPPRDERVAAALERGTQRQQAARSERREAVAEKEKEKKAENGKTARGQKRPAESSAGAATASKRTRQTRLQLQQSVPDSDDEEEDDMKFRFKSRRK